MVGGVKRLEEGVLLCMLWFERGRSSLLFFTVSDKQTDPKNAYGLCSHDYLATTTAKLATKDQHDMELMVRKSHGDNMGFLIELSGIILATFIPILENVQRIQRLSRLPFDNGLSRIGLDIKTTIQLRLIYLLRYMPGIATSIFLLSRY